jgi:hypothetical protein
MRSGKLFELSIYRGSARTVASRKRVRGQTASEETATLSVAYPYNQIAGWLHVT